ncbi:ubiquitin ligase skp1-like protein [Vairimorpha apis BRL 01]|uniref:Ubiquitin ligase skp1-like protein n=1 Tax=Vairimorpha apis BRL 01 TaxID=1037528 RepID=T0MGD7_9MICR|nr:ubiquitin ligase skp1-like protein [Vairimorpha apis BRL 01]
MLCKTIDGYILDIDLKHIHKSALLNNIYTSTTVEEPISLIVLYENFKIIYKFMEIDTNFISHDCNPIDIKFKQSDIEFFKDYDYNKLIELSNTCNYLEYRFCLEVCCKLLAEKIKFSKCNLTNVDIDEIKDFDWISSDE